MERENKKQINYGFVEPKIDSTHYVFGSGLLAGEVLQENGQWDDYLPEVELQYEPDFDTYNCTGFGTTNAIETLLKRLGVYKNFSDRYLGIVAGTKPPGNDPHTVAQAIRHHGLVSEQTLPFDQDLLVSADEYFSFKGGDEKKCEIEGANFLNTNSFGHDWVLTNGESEEVRTIKIKSALKLSPVCISVSAWYEKDGVYEDMGQQNNHWTLCYGSTDRGWKVFDSYDNSFKIVSYKHKIRYAKRYRISFTKQQNWFFDLWIRLGNFIKSILS